MLSKLARPQSFPNVRMVRFRYRRNLVCPNRTCMQDGIVIRTLDKAQRKYVFAQTGLEALHIRPDQIDLNLRMRRVKACNQSRQKYSPSVALAPTVRRPALSPASSFSSHSAASASVKICSA